jgi:hypothetical protein
MEEVLFSRCAHTIAGNCNPSRSRCCGYSLVFSNWLIVCTLFLALFLSLGKRRGELLLLKDNAENHRSVLVYYTIEYLDQLLLIVSAGALNFFYYLYLIAGIVMRLHNRPIVFKLPFVIYGLFRYLYLVRYQGEGSDPTKVLLTDKPIAICVVLWALTNIGLFMCGKVFSSLHFNKDCFKEEFFHEFGKN